MGFSFQSILIKKRGTPAQTKKAFLAAMKDLGYSVTDDPENGFAVRFVTARKSAYVCVTGDVLFESADRDVLTAIGDETQTPVLLLRNFASDWLEVRLYHEGRKQTFSYGMPPDPEMEQAEPGEHDLFAALLPDEEAKEAFVRLIHTDHAFSEEIVWGMAPLFGFNERLLYPEEGGKTETVLYFTKTGSFVPKLLPATDAPAFRINTYSYENPYFLDVNPAGGCGRGIRVIVKGTGFDTDQWRCPLAAVYSGSITDHGLSPEEEAHLIFRVRPERVTFTDGAKGWIADFPDAVIDRGLNPEHPVSGTHEGFEYNAARSWVVRYLLIPDKTVPREIIKPRFYSETGASKEHVHIFVVPMEHQDGFAYCRLVPYARMWTGGLEGWWLGEFKDEC